jgi:acyl carrier protein
MFEADERDEWWDLLVYIKRGVQKDMKESGYESWEDIDSLGKLEILAGVEEQMDINIPIDAVEDVHSLDEFVEACVYHQKRHADYEAYLEHAEQCGPNEAWALCLHDMIPKTKGDK